MRRAATGIASALLVAGCSGTLESIRDPAPAPVELRIVEGAHVPDPEWTLHLLREQRDVVAGILGASLREPLVLVALPAATWPRERTGAYQRGHAIYLRDDELHLPWRSYAHEIVHVHEEELPVRLPWFMSEGIACAIALDVEARILGRAGPVAEKEAALDQLLVHGDDAFDPRSGGRNPVLDLPAEPSDDQARSSAYAWATAIVRADAIRGGEGYFRRLFRSLADLPPRSAADLGPLSPDDALRLLRAAVTPPKASRALSQVAPSFRR